MGELIEIKVNEKDEQIVSARELYDALEIKTRYNDWFERIKEYGFYENQDYIAITQKRVTVQGNETTYTDHLIKIDMAKEIAMIQRSEKGQKVRRYFLEVEKEWNSPEKVMARALVLSNRELQTLRIDYKKLEEEMKKNKPKVLFANCVEGSKSSILVGDLAKLITQNGYEIGQNRLFSWLRENGYLIKNGERRNLPTQTSIEMGLFEIKESTHVNPNGSIRITRTPKVKGKGQIYFIKKFLSNKEN